MLDFEILNRFIQNALNLKIEREKSIVFSFNISVYESVKNQFQEGNIYEFNDTDKSVKLTSDNTCFYKNDDDLLSKKNKIPDNKNIVLIEHNNSLLSYDFKTKTQNDNKYFIRNLLAYKEFNNLLQNNKFCDINETATQKIVMFSDNYGINKIDYSSRIDLSLDEDFNYFTKVEIFKKYISKDDVFVEYLKSEIIKILKGIDYQKQINSLMNSIDYLIFNAEKEYRIYLKKFSFETLKNELIKAKEKYFSSSREILSKVFTQVIAIPASVTALLFVISKLNAELIVKAFLGTYTLVTLFSVVIQISYFFDNKDLSKSFIREFDIIKEDSGLQKEEIEIERRKIVRKINLNYILIIILLFLTIALLITAYYFGNDRIDILLNSETKG